MNGTDCFRGIHEAVARWARAKPRHTAVRAGASTLTYAELDADADRLAAHLIGTGVRPGDVVAVPGTREPATIVALLGILKAGGTYLALESDTTRWRPVLRDAGVTVIVAPGPDSGLDEAATGCRVVREWGGEPAAGVPADPERPAYVAYTSGSTGEPKGVRVPHRGVLRLVVDATYLPVRQDDVFLQLAPLAFDASTLEVWGALANGACLVLAPRGDLSLSRLTGVVRDEGVTVLWLTAGLFHQVVDVGLADVRGLRILLAGGDVLAVDRVNKAVAELPDTLLINGYGPTENTTFTACHPIRQPVTALSVPIGREIDRTKVYLLDADQAPVADGEPGELYAAGEGLALDYLGRPAATADRFLPDPFGGPGTRMFRTGDLARRLPDGTLEFLGRVDGQVKIRGFRVETGAVELAVRRLPGVTDVAVVAPRTPTGDRRLVAFVVADKAAEVSTVAWRDQLAERLRAHEVPAVIRVVEALPLNPNGKVDRAALEQRTGAERPELSDPYREPETDVETAVVRLWTDLLEIDGIGADDDFFELGGHSLMAVRILGELRLHYGVDITPLDFYLDPTPAGLARRITGAPVLDTL